MQILEEAISILTRHDYLVSRIDRAGVRFEDDSLLGFLFELDAIDDIVKSWIGVQTKTLQEYAEALRSSPTKAWNLYFVFLSPSAPTSNEKKDLIAIEEDFRSSRKIAQGNITTTGALTRALYPVLPIQNTILGKEAENPLARLRLRLKDIPPEAVETVLAEGQELSLRRFLEAHGYSRD